MGRGWGYSRKKKMGGLCGPLSKALTKITKIDSLFLTKICKKKPIPFEAAHTYIADIREYPSPKAK
jgi:hypothetical protein